MSTSYNGWFASPNLSIRPLVVAGESFVPGVLDDDDVYTVLHYVATQMHERVEPIVRDDWHQMDDWGFHFKTSANDSSVLSCHSSGTAFDYNATRHPNGVEASRTFTAAQISEIRKIVAEAGVVKWGGDFNGTPDAMHFEINGTKAEVAAAARRIRNGLQEEDEMKQEDFERIRDIVAEVVENKINDPKFLTKVANKVATGVWGRKFETVGTGGAKVKQNASAFVKDTWTAVKAKAK